MLLSGNGLHGVSMALLGFNKEKLPDLQGLLAGDLPTSAMNAVSSAIRCEEQLPRRPLIPL